LQGAVGGIESEIYEKVIAPFKSDLPRKNDEGFERVCTRHRYAFLTSHFFARIMPCQLVTLPGTSYPETLTYIITKNNPYKSLMNWR
jgi:hypothetical protein